MHTRHICWPAFVLLAATASHAQVTFEFTKGAGLVALEGAEPAKAKAIYDNAVLAGGYWGSLLGDKITIKMTLDYDGKLGSIASTSGGASEHLYSAVKPALIDDAKSAYDFTATGALQAGPALKLWVNDTSDKIFPEFEPYFDFDGSENNTTMWFARANAKALGLIAPDHGDAGADGKITVGGSKFDFDPKDGIDGDSKDYIGTMMHEMGHALGFTSGADFIGAMLPTPFKAEIPEEDTWMVSVLDLYRYSAESLGSGPGIFDISIPVPSHVLDRFFSIDGGFTSLAPFSTGTVLLGDGKGAGHWKADELIGMWIGLMDPTLGDGFELTKKFFDSLEGFSLDLTALDVIGYDIIPAPGTALVLLPVLLAAGRRRR